MPKSDPTPAQIQETLAYIEQEVKQALVASLGAMLGADAVQAETAPAEVNLDDLLWFQQEFLPKQTGFVFLGLSKADAAQVGQKLLVASGLEGESDDTAIDTLKEVLAQMGGVLATKFSARLKREISAGKLTQEEPSKPSASISIKIKNSGEELGTAVTYFMPQLIDTLMALPAEQEKLPAVVPPGSSSMPSNTRNLDLLLDVEMPVSVSFGRAPIGVEGCGES